MGPTMKEIVEMWHSCPYNKNIESANGSKDIKYIQNGTSQRNIEL
jgi:hypothetical protein